MNGLAVTFLMLLFLAATFSAQEKKRSASVESKMPLKTKRIQFWVFGSIEVPHGYQAKIIETRRDAPYGFIYSEDKKTKIGFSYGMVGSAINENNEKDFAWVKTLVINNRQISYGLVKKDGKKEIIAATGVNFFQEIEKDDEIELFLNIIKTFKVGRCDECEKPSL